MFPASHRCFRARTLLFACVFVACLGLAAPRTARAQEALPPPGQAGPPRPARGPAPENAQLEVAARLSLGAPPAAPAAIDGGMAYVPLRTGQVVAVDLVRTRIRWKVDGAVTSAPAAGDGLVYLPQRDGLSALGADGTSRWRVPVEGGLSAPPLWKAGWLIATAKNGDVMCLRAVDGQRVWGAHVTSPVRHRPSLTADHVYLSLEDGRITAYDLTTGALAWERKLDGAPGPILALDDRIFVGATDKFFYCLAAGNGKRKWRWRMGGVIIGEPVIDTQQVYFVALDNVLRALHRWNGSQRWKQGLAVRPSGSPLLVGSILYVAGVAAEVDAYRAATGAAAGKFEAPAELASPPQVMREELDLLSAVVLLTRVGDLQVLRRRLEPALIPLDYPVGLPAPLVPPPAPATPTS